MPKGFAESPDADRYVLANARVPSCLIDDDHLPQGPDGLCDVHLSIEQGRLAAITPVAAGVPADRPSTDMHRGLVLPCFTDMHTHIDKGHIWPRAANPDGSFDGALAAVGADRTTNWSAGDVRRRMDFSLRCAHAHGTAALRTHLDSVEPQHTISWPVFDEVRADWKDRIKLQAVCLIGIEEIRKEGFLEDLAQMVVRHSGVLGAVTYMLPDLEDLLDRIFRTALDRGLDLDFHVDETGDPTARSLHAIATKVLQHKFPGTVTVGHCCSISRQSREQADRTLDLVAEAGLAIVSLPMCNMYLQDRQDGVTPHWRGVTLLHEMKARGNKVAVASDNTRDPFYAYGDLDMLEVFREATRILHLDHPTGDWISTVTSNPAQIMALPGAGRLTVGSSADLVLLRARTYTELNARPQSDRTIVRNGKAVDTSLPDYAELDDLMGE